MASAGLGTIPKGSQGTHLTSAAYEHVSERPAEPRRFNNKTHQARPAKRRAVPRRLHVKSDSTEIPARPPGLAPCSQGLPSKLHETVASGQYASELKPTAGSESGNSVPLLFSGDHQHPCKPQPDASRAPSPLHLECSAPQPTSGDWAAAEEMIALEGAQWQQGFDKVVDLFFFYKQGRKAVVWGDEPEAVGILTYVMDETAVAELQRQQQPTSSDSTSERRSPSANDAAAPIMATIVTPDDGQQGIFNATANPCYKQPEFNQNPEEAQDQLQWDHPPSPSPAAWVEHDELGPHSPAEVPLSPSSRAQHLALPQAELCAPPVQGDSFLDRAALVTLKAVVESPLALTFSSGQLLCSMDGAADVSSSRRHRQPGTAQAGRCPLMAAVRRFCSYWPLTRNAARASETPQQPSREALSASAQNRTDVQARQTATQPEPAASWKQDDKAHTASASPLEATLAASAYAASREAVFSGPSEPLFARMAPTYMPANAIADSVTGRLTATAPPATALSAPGAAPPGHAPSATTHATDATLSHKVRMPEVLDNGQAVLSVAQAPPAGSTSAQPTEAAAPLTATGCSRMRYTVEQLRQLGEHPPTSAPRLDCYGQYLLRIPNRGAVLGPPSRSAGHQGGPVLRTSCNTTPLGTNDPGRWTKQTALASAQPGHPDAKGLAANRSAAAGKPADSGLYHSQTPADTWKIGSLFQPTPPAHALHHSCNRYQVGSVVTDNPEEEKRQKELKSLLNRVTPEKYDTIKARILGVGLQSAVTMQGFVCQIFEKALMEPTFCQIYAALCHDLHQVLPDLEESSDAGAGHSSRPVRFNLRALLLNKCQSEFEKGLAGMAELPKGSNSSTLASPEQGHSSGGTCQPQILVEENGFKARRRSLGNIQLIGHLYRQGLVSESIMHCCILQFLGDASGTCTDYTAPARPEDAELVCKLMATAGRQLDAGAKNAGAMDAYFACLEQWSRSPGLESRLRFMLKDTIDLRANGWEERRAVEGPKTIAEIHSAAARETIQASASAAGCRASTDRAPRPPETPSSPLRLHHGLSRPDGQHKSPLRRLPLTQQLQSDPSSASLRPRGGGSCSAAQSSAGPIRAHRAHVTSSERARPCEAAELASAPSACSGAATEWSSAVRQADPMLPTSPHCQLDGKPPVAPAPGLSEDDSRTRSADIIRAFFRHELNHSQAIEAAQELERQGCDMATAVDAWVAECYLLRSHQLRSEMQAFHALLDALTGGQHPLLKPQGLQRGLQMVLDGLADASVDVPFAPGLVGGVLAVVVGNSAIALTEVSTMLQKAGPQDAEDGDTLVESGHAATVMAELLQTWGGRASLQALAAWKQSDLGLQALLPQMKRNDPTAVNEVTSSHQLALIVC